MQLQDSTTGKLVALKPTPIEEVRESLKEAGVKVSDKALYTAWYLYNMARADYAKALSSNVARAQFVAETINDPDCCPEAVLECFVAKMCAMGEPIHWEELL